MNDLKNTKGVVFIVVLIYLVIGIFLIGNFIIMTSREYNITKQTNDNIRAFYDAEGGAYRGLAELRKRVQTDLATRVKKINVSNASIIDAYYQSKNSLGFLADYAYADGQPQFTVSGEVARLTIPSITGFNYIGQIIIKMNGNPSYNSTDNSYTFLYTYDTIQSRSSVGGTIGIGATAKRVLLSRAFNITVFPPTFASYALFTNKQQAASGSNIWFMNSTNFSGPVHTNDRFNFALNPSGTFTGLVTQAQQTARFFNNGANVLLDADKNGTKDVPTFQAGFKRGQKNIPMPTTVDKDLQRRKALGLADGQPIPTYGTTINIPTSGGAVKGGIYVEGDAEIQMGVSGKNAVYNITSTYGTTKKITVDYTNNQTKVETLGGSTDIYKGTLNGMVFVNNGRITSLSGKVQKDSKVTIAATKDVVFGGHTQYENYIPGPPPSATGANTLGVMSWDGNVRIATSAPNNINIHATIMAPNGEFRVDNYNSGSARGTATVLGGVITNTYGAFGTFNSSGIGTGYGRNFVYDTRMSQGNSPPFFPTLPNFDASESGLNTKPVWGEQ